MRPDTSPDHAADLIDRYEADPSPPTLVALERALMVTGPVLHKSSVYGIADARFIESLEVFHDVQRAEMVRVP